MKAMTQRGAFTPTLPITVSHGGIERVLCVTVEQFANHSHENILNAAGITTRSPDDPNRLTEASLGATRAGEEDPDYERTVVGTSTNVLPSPCESDVGMSSDTADNAETTVGSAPALDVAIETAHKDKRYVPERLRVHGLLTINRGDKKGIIKVPEEVRKYMGDSDVKVADVLNVFISEIKVMGDELKIDIKDKLVFYSVIAVATGINYAVEVSAASDHDSTNVESLPVDADAEDAPMDEERLNKMLHGALSRYAQTRSPGSTGVAGLAAAKGSVSLEGCKVEGDNLTNMKVRAVFDSFHGSATSVKALFETSKGGLFAVVAGDPRLIMGRFPGGMIALETSPELQIRDGLDRIIMPEAGPSIMAKRMQIPTLGGDWGEVRVAPGRAVLLPAYRKDSSLHCHKIALLVCKTLGKLDTREKAEIDAYESAMDAARKLDHWDPNAAVPVGAESILFPIMGSLCAKTRTLKERVKTAVDTVHGRMYPELKFAAIYCRNPEEIVGCLEYARQKDGMVEMKDMHERDRRGREFYKESLSALQKDRWDSLSDRMRGPSAIPFEREAPPSPEAFPAPPSPPRFPHVDADNRIGDDESGAGDGSTDAGAQIDTVETLAQKIRAAHTDEQLNEHQDDLAAAQEDKEKEAAAEKERQVKEEKEANDKKFREEHEAAVRAEQERAAKAAKLAEYHRQRREVEQAAAEKKRTEVAARNREKAEKERRQAERRRVRAERIARGDVDLSESESEIEDETMMPLPQAVVTKITRAIKIRGQKMQRGLLKSMVRMLLEGGAQNVQRTFQDMGTQTEVDDEGNLVESALDVSAMLESAIADQPTSDGSTGAGEAGEQPLPGKGEKGVYVAQPPEGAWFLENMRPHLDHAVPRAKPLLNPYTWHEDLFKGRDEEFIDAFWRFTAPKPNTPFGPLYGHVQVGNRQKVSGKHIWLTDTSRELSQALLDPHNPRLNAEQKSYAEKFGGKHFFMAFADLPVLKTIVEKLAKSLNVNGKAIEPPPTPGPSYRHGPMDPKTMHEIGWNFCRILRHSEKHSQPPLKMDTGGWVKPHHIVKATVDALDHVHDTSIRYPHDRDGKNRYKFLWDHVPNWGGILEDGTFSAPTAIGL